MGDFFSFFVGFSFFFLLCFSFSLFHHVFTQNSSTLIFWREEDKEKDKEEDKEDKEDKEENDDEDIIIIIIEAAAAVALQKVLDEIVFSCHRRVDSFDVLGCAELRATTRTKTKSDDNDEGGE